jgi:pilus assembly protein CpaB
MKIHRNWAVLAAAVLIGTIAALSVQRYIRQRMEAMQPRPVTGATVSLVVANADLGKGARLDVANVAVRKVPREWAHSNAIREDQFERVEQMALATAAARGEPILWAQLEGTPAPSFSSHLQLGRRAVTVPVDEISSISGMVAPGDAVDLIVAARNDGKVVMLPVMQDAKVLATGTQVQPGRKDDAGRSRTFTTVTLDATPEEARRIMAAREVGRLTALLRAPGDTASHGLRAAEAYALLGLGAGPRVGMAPAVQVLYGGRVAPGAVAALPARGAGAGRPSDP